MNPQGEADHETYKEGVLQFSHFQGIINLVKNITVSWDHSINPPSKNKQASNENERKH